MTQDYTTPKLRQPISEDLNFTYLLLISLFNYYIFLAGNWGEKSPDHPDQSYRLACHLQGRLSLMVPLVLPLSLGALVRNLHRQAPVPPTFEAAFSSHYHTSRILTNPDSRRKGLNFSSVSQPFALWPVVVVLKTRRKLN